MDDRPTNKTPNQEPGRSSDRSTVHLHKSGHRCYSLLLGYHSLQMGVIELVFES